MIKKTSVQVVRKIPVPTDGEGIIEISLVKAVDSELNEEAMDKAIRKLGLIPLGFQGMKALAKIKPSESSSLIISTAVADTSGKRKLLCLEEGILTFIFFESFPVNALFAAK
ncbi:MAG: hypothetical protein AAB808_00240 [Patescibacteria group bacterium]